VERQFNCLYYIYLNLKPSLTRCQAARSAAATLELTGVAVVMPHPVE
jgi:hypothetical protein